MDSPSSSSLTKTKTKLSVRNQTRFKNSSFSSKKITNISMREHTMLNKAYELSTLCDIQLCVLYYGRDGELIKTWPEDQSKVRDMAERFSKLSDKERRKKSTNLSQFLNKKINDEKKRPLDKNDNKFSDKVLEMEHSLESRLRIFQDKLRLLQTEPDQRLAVLPDCGASRTEQDSSDFFSSADLSPSLIINDPLMMNLSTPLVDDQSLVANSSGFTTDLSPSLIDDPHHQQWTEPLTNQHLSGVYSGGFATDPLMNHRQSKFSFYLYNHDNGSFSQLADQAMAPYNNLDLLGPQGIGLRSCSNNMVNPPQMQTQNPLLNNMVIPLQMQTQNPLLNNMVIPPQMQTQNPLLHYDQLAGWNQTPYFGVQ